MKKDHPYYQIWAQSKNLALRKLILRWDEIARLHIVPYANRHRIRIGIQPIDALRLNLPVWLYDFFPLMAFSFGNAMAHSFFDWLRAEAPVDSSVHSSYHYRRLMPDAYLVASEALIESFDPGALPEAEDFVRGKPTPAQLVPGILMVLGAMLLGVISCGLNTTLPNRPLGFFLLICGLASAMVGILGLLRLNHQTSYWRESDSLRDFFD